MTQQVLPYWKIRDNDTKDEGIICIVRGKFVWAVPPPNSEINEGDPAPSNITFLP
jgi:hypothetical protein